MIFPVIFFQAVRSIFLSIFISIHVYIHVYLGMTPAILHSEMINILNVVLVF